MLGSGEPKYLNSPETPIFHKGDQLYHLHAAKHAIRKSGFAVLVEGYFDVQRLVFAGIEQVVAPLGTAMTENQALLLKRYTNDVVLVYDSDAAGLKATFRAGDVLLSHGVRVRVATLPPGQDPDTLVQRGGAAAFERILADAVDVLERKLQLLDGKGWFNDLSKSREALDRLLPTLRAANDPVTRELYTSRIAERLGIPRDTISNEALRAAATAPPARLPQQEEAAPSRSRPRGRAPGAEIERKLLRLLLLHPQWLERARHEVDPTRFTVPAYRAIYDALMALPDRAPVGDAAGALDARASETWAQLVDRESPGEGYDLDREYAGALEALEEIHAFPDIAAETDPASRSRRWMALSKEGQARFRLYLATRPPARAARAVPPAKESD